MSMQLNAPTIAVVVLFILMLGHIVVMHLRVHRKYDQEVEKGKKDFKSILSLMRSKARVK